MNDTQPAWERYRVMSNEIHEMLIGAAQCRNHLQAIIQTAQEFEGLTPYMSDEATEDCRTALTRLTQVGI